MKIDPLKLHHPFFLPVERRAAVTGLCLLWGGGEVLLGNPGWGVFFVGLGAYLAYKFFLRFDPEDYRDPSGDDQN